jgi:MFS family permease
MLFGARPVYAGLIDTDSAAATQAAFNLLFWSAFVFSIAQGLYEAVINPMIAQLYPENQTHYLNILHAGWPAGMIIGGIIAVCFIGGDAWVMELQYWEIPLASFTVFVLLYGILALPTPFPQTVSEKTKGNYALLFSCFLSPLFLLLLVLHACIGYVELGVDSWVAKLMANLLPNAILILVYTSFLMFILRFFAGPIVHRINPIGLLFVSSVIACIGLLWLGSDIQSVGMIFVAATFYSLGKAFFWPTMLGVAGERFPQSGAIAMGALGAAGMLTVGLLANEAIGYKQSLNASKELKKSNPEVFERYAEKEEIGFLENLGLQPNLVSAANSVKVNEDGTLDTAAFEKLRTQADEATKAQVEAILPMVEQDYQAVKAADIWGGRRALTLTAFVPAGMAVGFLVLLLYFSVNGGYKKLRLNDDGEVVIDEDAH